MSSEEIVSVHQASYSFAKGSPVLQGVTLDVERGETVAILGRSGSGKSTLLACLGLLAPFDRGSRYYLNGHDVGTLSDREIAHVRAQTLGFVPQHSGLIAHLTVLENVALPLMHERSMRYTEITNRAQEQLETLGIGALARRRPHELSGGEKQRVAIARALVLRPLLILADEPTGALDEATAEEVVSEMLSATRNADASLVIVTHDHAVAHRMHRSLRLIGGRLTSETASA